MFAFYKKKDAYQLNVFNHNLLKYNLSKVLRNGNKLENSPGFYELNFVSKVLVCFLSINH